MKKKYFFLLLMFTIFVFQIHAQIPNLPIKAGLATTLSSSKTFSNGVNLDVITFPLSNQNEFTLELKAKINAVQGRGLDVEFQNSFGLGLRTSLDKTTFNNSSSLTAFENLSTSVDNSQEQTYRYAVKDGAISIYQDGHYLATKSLVSLNNNTLNNTMVYGSDNFLGKWAGIVGNNSGKPTDYGWSNTSTSIPWNTANSTGGVRYLDVTSGHTFESDGAAYNGRIMYIRWDNGTYSSSTYSYPIQLESGNQYEFSWLYEYVSNAAPGAKMNVAIASSPDGSGVIASKSFVTGNATKLRKGDLSFVSQTQGTYYLTITGDAALFGIGDLKLKSSNLMNTWDGFENNNSGTPAAYGWANTYNSLPWSALNATSGVRYMDVTSGHTYESDGANFNGRLLYLDWNNLAYENSTYSFPVTLKGNINYNFSGIYELLAGTSGATITVGVSANQNGTSPIATKSFATADINKLRVGEFLFKPLSDGTYYITLTGNSASFAIGRLGVKEAIMAQIVVGKNYADGAVDMIVNSITFDDMAYAPDKIIAPSTTILEIADNKSFGTIAKSKVVLNASASLYVKNGYSPLINSTVDLNSTDARVYFENIKPSDVVNLFLKYISVKGSPASNAVNVDVSRSGSGTIVAPYSADYMPLEVFTEENFGGTSKQYATVTPQYDLGTFDNKIKSFKLKKGYMASFASNGDGTGYSRVFVAEDQDLEISVMPAYLKGTVSFIRTMKWHEVAKKGFASGSNESHDALNVSWFYNWNSGLDSTPNKEYVPIRQSQYWPGFEAAYTKEGYTHFLGFNEPDRPDQANMAVQPAIDTWPGLLKSGLRLGSPATSDPFNPWMGDFMAKAEAKNYRIDYVALHCYWYKSAAQWQADLLNIYNRYHRPIWITEWNIGANWTGNSFPDGPSLLTDANATKHKNDLAAVLNVLETSDYVERYSIYNWVEDARAMYVTINDAFKTRNTNWANYQWLKTATIVSGSAGSASYDVLTPAGEYYAKNASAKAYNPTREYVPTWTPIAETLSYELTSDYKNITIKWPGVNQDLVNKYVIERRLEGETNFSVFYESTQYSVINTNDVVHSKAEYRIKVIGKDDVASAYSPIITFTQATIPLAPSDLKAVAISSTLMNLTWSAVDKAEAYNVKRANSIDGVYNVIVPNLIGTSFQDSGLTKNTSYFYKISAVNSGGESPNSAAVTAKTLDIIVPVKTSNLILASGDAQVKLRWDAMYDVKFYVKRSTSELGPYTTIATTESSNYTDGAVSNGTAYYYKVAAFNTSGEGVDSTLSVAKPNSGQHSYYDFNENALQSPLDQWGFHMATLNGNASLKAGKIGNGLSLDGTTNSYLNIEAGNVKDLTNFTISTWFKLDESQNWSRIFDFGSGSNTYMFLTNKNGANGNVRFAFKNGGAEEQINSTVVAQIGVWTHVAVTLNGAVGVLYIDGVEVGRNSAMTVNPSMLGLTTQNYIGKSQFSDPYLKGTIDDFRIYNKALNASEITALVNTIPAVLDDDKDGIVNSVDLCPNTPTGETVDINGCSSSQKDTDKDGIMDNLDQCPNTQLGQVVNVNGCSSSQLDDDKDGVPNSLDLCPNSLSGELVNANGCFTLPEDNFTITQVGETCPNKNNGQLVMVAKASHSYVATINNVVKNFTNNSLIISDLAPGVYPVCITIQGKTFEQCYSIEIPKSNAITGKTVTTSDKVLVEVQSGTAPYQVVVNGVVQFETNKTNFDVKVASGDLLEVKTAKDCEGVLAKTITLFDIVKAFPNPTTGQFDVYLPTNDTTVAIGIYTADAKLISISNYHIENGKVRLNIENQPSGIYFVKIKSNPEEVVQIIKK